MVAQVVVHKRGDEGVGMIIAILQPMPVLVGYESVTWHQQMHDFHPYTPAGFMQVRSTKMSHSSHVAMQVRDRQEKKV